MEELKTTFTKRGNTYKQVYVSPLMYIYRVFCQECSAKPYFELFRPKIGKPGAIKKDYWQMYPSDDAFGKWAWCSSNLASVRRMLVKHFPDDTLNGLTDEELEAILNA